MMKMQELANLWPLGRIKRRFTGCCLMVTLGLILACAAFFGLTFVVVRLASAQTPGGAQEVLLLIDNSASMYEKDGAGAGSDPDLLRIESARHFINYLGVDSSHTHRLGVIFFGTEANLVVPLTPLAGDARRTELSQLIDQPERMGWTHPEAALQLALDTFETSSRPSAAGQAVVLLTDGKPEWSTAPTPQETQETIARLQDLAGRFVAREIPLFIILLQNPAATPDPELEQLYIPLWQEIAPGHFYRAAGSEDLLNIYHHIVVSLTGRQTQGVVLQTQVQSQTIRAVPVEPHLAQVTLVIRKSDPALTVTITRPDGQALTPTDDNVQYAGRPGRSREEIWAITRPHPGNWQVQLNGQGTVIVWKDFIPDPPTPTFTPTATPSPSPTATATSLPTATPTFTPTPSPLPPSVPTVTLPPLLSSPPPSSLSNSSSLITWLIAVPLLAGVAGSGYWLWQQQRARPMLSGTLRLVSAPPHIQPPPPARLELDGQKRRTITLGPAAGSGLILPDTPETATPTAKLSARLDPDGQPEVVLVVMAGKTEAPPVRVEQLVQVDGVPITDEWPLKDGNVITLGAYRFKYENLRQRSTWQPARRPHF